MFSPKMLLLALPLLIAPLDFVPSHVKSFLQSDAEKEVVLIGAGDIADCADLAGAEATAKLLEATPGTVMALGDLAYPNGTAEDFKCYDKTWGRVKEITKPQEANHKTNYSGAN